MILSPTSWEHIKNKNKIRLNYININKIKYKILFINLINFKKMRGASTPWNQHRSATALRVAQFFPMHFCALIFLYPFFKLLYSYWSYSKTIYYRIMCATQRLMYSWSENSRKQSQVKYLAYSYIFGLIYFREKNK